MVNSTQVVAQMAEIAHVKSEIDAYNDEFDKDSYPYVVGILLFAVLWSTRSEKRETLLWSTMKTLVFIVLHIAMQFVRRNTPLELGPEPVALAVLAVILLIEIPIPTPAAFFLHVVNWFFTEQHGIHVKKDQRRVDEHKRGLRWVQHIFTHVGLNSLVSIVSIREFLFPVVPKSHLEIACDIVEENVTFIFTHYPVLCCTLVCYVLYIRMGKVVESYQYQDVNTLLSFYDTVCRMLETVVVICHLCVVSNTLVFLHGQYFLLVINKILRDYSPNSQPHTQTYPSEEKFNVEILHCLPKILMVAAVAAVGDVYFKMIVVILKEKGPDSGILTKLRKRFGYDTNMTLAMTDHECFMRITQHWGVEWCLRFVIYGGPLCLFPVLYLFLAPSLPGDLGDWVSAASTRFWEWVFLESME
jgi:hypothetical protein